MRGKRRKVQEGNEEGKMRWRNGMRKENEVEGKNEVEQAGGRQE